MKNDYAIDLSYQQAYRVRKEALELIRGVLGASYNLLSKYLHVLKNKNNGTIYQLLLDEHNNFLNYFLALESCIKGFMESIRPMIAMDWTHMKEYFSYNKLG